MSIRAHAPQSSSPRARGPRRGAERLLAVGLLLLSNGCAGVRGGEEHAIPVVGAIEVLRVEEARLDFLARIDTGARSSSIHALDLEIADEATRVEDNVGKEIRFRVANERGDSAHLVGVIADVIHVRSAQGTEARYAVPLALTWNGVSKRVRVNLRDRAAMDCKLLVGRDWLRGSALVDVDRNAVE